MSLDQKLKTERLSLTDLLAKRVKPEDIPIYKVTGVYYGEKPIYDGERK